MERHVIGLVPYGATRVRVGNSPDEALPECLGFGQAPPWACAL